MMIVIVILAIFLINTIFGYWRAGTRKFSPAWISAIHLPVPVAIGLRLWLLGWNWFLLPVFVVDFAAGQYTGGWIRQSWQRSGGIRTSSWLVGDMFKQIAARLGKKQSAA